MKPRHFLPIAVLALLCPSIPAADPAWWRDEATRVIEDGAEENNKGPANIGQAKHMADMALKSLATVDQSLSDAIRQKLTTPQPNPADPTGPNLPPILSLTVPSPKPSDWADLQKAPLLIGQLKAIAAPFYTHLHDSSVARAAWLAAERTANGTNHPESIFPWTADPADDSNKAIATIGQLKAVFSLGFATLPETNFDTDNDGLPDDWEIDQFGTLLQDGQSDLDFDGIDNLTEFQAGGDPKSATDTDGDGMDDAYEIAANMDMHEADQNGNGIEDGWDDMDGDGYLNLEEIVAGTPLDDPTVKPDGESSSVFVVSNGYINRRTKTVIAYKNSLAFQERQIDPERANEKEFYQPEFYKRLNENYIDEVTVEGDVWSSSLLARRDITYSLKKDDPIELQQNVKELKISQSQLDTYIRTVKSSDSPDRISTEVIGYNPEINVITGDDTSFYIDDGRDILGGDYRENLVSSEIIEVDSPTEWKLTGDTTYDLYGDRYKMKNSHAYSLAESYPEEEMLNDMNEVLSSTEMGIYGKIYVNHSSYPNGIPLSIYDVNSAHTELSKTECEYYISRVVDLPNLTKVIFIWSEDFVRDYDEQIDTTEEIEPAKIFKAVITQGIAQGVEIKTQTRILKGPEDPGFIRIPPQALLKTNEIIGLASDHNSTNPPGGPLVRLQAHAPKTNMNDEIKLVASGVGKIKVWEKRDESYLVRALPYTLGNDEKTGFFSNPKQYFIQGIEPGNVTIALKKGSSDLVYQNIRVVDIDLDVDSDNSGQIDHSEMEDQIEDLATEHGKVLISNPVLDTDGDGIPNFNDMDNAGTFTEITIRTSNLTASDKIRFYYSAASPKAGNAGETYASNTQPLGSLRIWKKNGDVARSINDFINAHIDYNLSDLEITPGQDKKLYIEGLDTGRQRIGVECAGVRDQIVVNLLPVDLISDLNNDGQITAADNPLRDAAMASGATDEIKAKGTEYILQDDVMSNGAWDNQDQDGNICFDWPQYGNLDRAPAAGEMDDDAIAIEVKAPSFGVAWFTHEAIGSLSFFREKECLNAIAINLEQPFDLSTQLPERLWIKFRPTVSTVATVKGKLTFHIGKSPSEEWGKIDLPLTLVPDFGCEKFFEAARNYIFERNTQVFLWDYKMPDRFSPSQIFRLCVMREEATTAKGYDAYANNKKGIGAVALAAGFNPPTVMINGNQCFFQAGYEEGVNLDLIWMVNQIADRCHGRVIIGGATAGISSDNFDNSTQPAPGSDLAGPDPVGNFAGIDGIYGTADDIPNPRAANPGGKFFSLSGSTWNFAAGLATGTDAVGGLSSNYASSIRSDKAHQMFGRVPCGEQGKGCVFTATQIYGVGQAPAFAAAAKRSGNKMLSPSVDFLAQELLILDSGGGSLALQHIDPVGNLRKGYIGRKSATGFPYYVNNYVQFWATKPRP